MALFGEVVAELLEDVLDGWVNDVNLSAKLWRVVLILESFVVIIDGFDELFSNAPSLVLLVNNHIERKNPVHNCASDGSDYF